MASPSPDPTGRPSSRKREIAEPSASRPSEGGHASKDITHSHANIPEPQAAPESFSELFANTGSSRRITVGSDILQSLGAPPGATDDDAPTVITQRNQSNSPAPPSEPQPIIGRRLGHYELIESVGAGGMAAVLRARDLELGRIVALKILPPDSARDPESIIRFKQEARAAAMLDHENIARVYSCGEDQGLYFIAFEFVEGINMRVMIDRRGPLPTRECIGYMIQVAAGLAHAAERGVVHRDIKPSNLVITRDGRVKIVDMGLARQLDSTPVNGGVTQSGVTLGTFDYISPEQALDPRRADVRSDIYSLGCAFYHALTGRPPVPEGTAAKKLHAHQHIDPLDPRQLNPHIPDEIVFVLARMMAKDPTKRYQTPAELISDLKGLAERLQLSADAVGKDSVVRALAGHHAMPQPPRIRLGGVIAVVAVAAAVAVFAVSGGTPGAHQVTPPWAAAEKKAPGLVLPENPDPVTQNPRPIPENDVVRNPEQLLAKLTEIPAEGPTKVYLAPGAVLDLTNLPDAVAFKGKELELIGSVNAPAVIRVSAAYAELPLAAPSPRAGVLSLAGTDIAISGVWFEVVKPQRPEESKPATLVGLLFPEANKVTLSDCVVTTPKGVGGVRVGRSKARVRVERCAFAATTFGLWVPDACEATVTDCGFGPHDAAVQTGDSRMGMGMSTEGGPPQPASIRLDRSSFLFGPDSAAIRNTFPGSDAPAARVTAGHCVFARVAAAGSFIPGVQWSRPVVVRCLGSQVDTQFTGDRGRRNAYYGVTPLAVTAIGEPRYLSFEQCKTEDLPVSDSGAVQLAKRPWANPDPDGMLHGANPWRAFALTFTDASLFMPAGGVFGAQFYNPNNSLVRWRAYPDLQGGFPPPPKNATEPRQLIWHPTAPKDEPLPKDTYTDLAFLLTNARPGDTVLIRHNGLLSVEKTVELEKPRNGTGELRLTFRADRGSFPILAAPGNDKLDQALFHLVNGEVSFEGIQFLLKPARPKNAQIVAAVTVIGGRTCSFRDCIFTLAEEDDSRAASVHLADPDKVMAMDSGNRPEPTIKYERCLFRGKGRGVWNPVSRGVKVDIDQSLLALDGPVFLAEPGGKPNVGARSSLRLNRLTVFAGGPIVKLRGGRPGDTDTSGVVPLEVHANECLFASVPAAGQPLVELDGIGMEEAKTLLEWRVQTANRYANFDDKAVVMVVRPPTEGSTPKELSWDQWITFAGEKDGKPIGRITFEKAPTGLSDLVSLKPGDANVKAIDFPDLANPKASDAGVRIESLPIPAVEP